MVNVYNREQTVKCKATFVDENGVAVDPSDGTLYIYGAGGALVDTIAWANIQNPLTGMIYGIYTIPEDAAYGDWKYRFEVTANGQSVVSEGYFVVQDGDVQHYCSLQDVYRHAGTTSSVTPEASVIDFILEAEDKINRLTGRSFYNNNLETEWLDIEDIDQDEDINTIFLSNIPVQAITTLEEYNRDGTLYKSWSSSDYWLDEKLGRIRLRNSNFCQQDHRVKVVYTYGYPEVPVAIKELAAIMAAMGCLINQIGGTYDDVTSYSLPSGVSIGVGEPYTNMREAITRMEKERDLLIKAIGQWRTRVVVI